MAPDRVLAWHNQWSITASPAEVTNRPDSGLYEKQAMGMRGADRTGERQRPCVVPAGRGLRAADADAAREPVGPILEQFQEKRSVHSATSP